MKLFLKNGFKLNRMVSILIKHNVSRNARHTSHIKINFLLTMRTFAQRRTEAPKEREGGKKWA